MTPDEIVFLDRLATRISETLYYASGALKDAHTKADEKFIRHDDYDRLRKMVREAKVAEVINGEDVVAEYARLREREA